MANRVITGRLRLLHGRCHCHELYVCRHSRTRNNCRQCQLHIHSYRGPVNLPKRAWLLILDHPNRSHLDWLRSTRLYRRYYVGKYVTQHYNASNYAYLDNWLMINASLHSVTTSVCGLWLCVQAYETSVNNGVSTQRIVGDCSETDYNATPTDTELSGYTL